MLIEIWERLRGYDKWVETEATVESSKEESHSTRGGSYETSNDVLMWADANGQRHRTSFTVTEDSSLYQAVTGSKISIRYDPADPEKYYLRDLLQGRIRAVLKVFAFVALLLGFFTFASFLGYRR